MNIPDFEWNGYFWESSVIFDEWSGFQERNGPYGAISSTLPSNGNVKVVFAPEARGGEPLNSNELRLIQWFLDNQKEVIKSILEGLYRAYPIIKESYLEEFGGEVIDVLPDITSVGDVKKVVGIISVNIHQVEKNEVPYIGVEMGCNWDEEHGLGLLLHGASIVEVGGADTAILLWKAREHANKT